MIPPGADTPFLFLFLFFLPIVARLFVFVDVDRGKLLAGLSRFSNGAARIVRKCTRFRPNYLTSGASLHQELMLPLLQLREKTVRGQYASQGASSAIDSNNLEVRTVQRKHMTESTVTFNSNRETWGQGRPPVLVKE